MKRPWRESVGLLPWLILIAIVLGVALLAKQWGSPRTPGDAGNFVDTFSKIITTVFLVIGGIFSYLKFFKGRTLSPKLIITPQSGVIHDQSGYLHWIETQIENKGSVAVWNYEVIIYATLHGGSEERIRVSKFMSPLQKPEQERNLLMSERLYMNMLF